MGLKAIQDHLDRVYGSGEAKSRGKDKITLFMMSDIG